MEAVFTAEKRVTFVEKTLGEVGDYTDFPIEVTGATIADKLDKIAEIYYRSKIAQFTENTLISDTGISSGVTTGSISPRVMVGSTGTGGYDPTLMCGYWSIDDLGMPSSANSLDFLDAQYSASVGSGLGSATTNVNFRDINERESGIWLYPDTGENPTWNKPMGSYLGMGFYFYTGSGTEMGLDDQDFKTAFSWYSISPNASYNVQPDIPVPYIQDDSFSPDIVYEELAVIVQFSGEIAWVGDSLYHPDTQFFLGMRVDGVFFSGFGSFTSSNDIGAGSSGRYVMRLSSGDLSCPLESSPAIAVGDIVHEAVEWWPYAKGSPATPVWNTATGAKL